MRRVLWVRAGIGDVLTRTGGFRRAAERIRERGFDAPTAEIVQGSDLHRFWVRGYDSVARPLWLCWAAGSGTPKSPYPLSDADVERLQRELTVLNSPPAVPEMEERVAQFVLDVAATFGRLARREDRVPTVTKRCFDFRQGSSSKFWTIEVVGKTAFVTYGRIGSSGSTQIKEFRSEHEVNQFSRKMISEKLGKGYEEVSSTLHPGAPAHHIERVSGAAPAPAASARAPTRPADDSAPTEGERHIDL